MKKLKQGIKVIIMFVLLFAIVGTPLLFMEYQNRRIINEIVLSPMQPVQIDGKNELIQDYNIWERIGIITQTIKVRSSILTDFKNEEIANLAVTEIIKTMEKQLTTLCEYNALPELTFSNLIEASVFKETYAYQPEEISSKLSISIWAIQAEYEDYYIYAYMDTEMSALYDITILSQNDDFVYQPDISKNGFLEYLLTFSPVSDIYVGDELFMANGSYTEQIISLHLCSINEVTNQFTNYRFTD